MSMTLMSIGARDGRVASFVIGAALQEILSERDKKETPAYNPVVLPVHCPSEMTEALDAYAQLDDLLSKGEAFQGSLNVPVLLPIGDYPRMTVDDDLEATRRLRDRYRNGLGRELRILPPILPELPWRVRERILDQEGDLHVSPYLDPIGRRLAGAILAYAERPHMDREAFEAAWRRIDAESPPIHDTVRRFGGLPDDLLRYTTIGPDPEEIRQAPAIDDYALGLAPERVLVGVAGGHPEVADGHAIVTSILVAMDPEQGWARTLSRLYTLGRPRTGDEDGMTRH